MAPGVEPGANRPIASIRVVGTSGNPTDADPCEGAAGACAKTGTGRESANATVSIAAANRFCSPEAGPNVTRFMIFSVVDRDIRVARDGRTIESIRILF